MYKPPKKASNMLKLYQTVGIILLCILLAVVSYGVTLSWFVDESITSNGKPNILVVGTVDLTVETNFNFYNLVLAPDTLYKNNIEDGQNESYATRIRTSDENDVQTIYVRAKFTTNRTELTLHFDNLTTATTYTSSELNKWVYNSADGYYYYLGEVGTSEIIFNSGYYVDNTLHNAPAGPNVLNAPNAKADVEINFVFESIQRPYGAYDAVWTTAPAIFDAFAKANSGYPKTN
jgi:hypothetical protein